MPYNTRITIRTSLAIIYLVPIASKVDLLEVVALIGYILLVLLPPRSPLVYSTTTIVILLICIFIQLIMLLAAI
jgi:hypothetical protein